MPTRSEVVVCLVCALGALCANPAKAMDQGDWLFRIGVSSVDPKSGNHPVVSVDSGTSATFNLSYMLTANWGVELLAAWPFEHDIHLVGGPEVGRTKHLPPTVSLQYHFLTDSSFRPYVGIGLNYTKFFSEKTFGPLAGVPLDLDASWGFAAQVGADILLGEMWFLNLSARYIGIESDATLGGDPLGEVQIDPWVYGANFGIRF